MIFRSPRLDVEVEVDALIAELRERLRSMVAEPRRWSGTIRRLTIARSVQGSNSIEGYVTGLDDVVAAMDNEPPIDADEGTRLAIDGYRDAMTYVLQLAQEPALRIDQSLVRSLHFMMIKHDLSKHPGRWRPGDIHVRRDSDGKVVYTGPDAGLVPAAMEELMADLAEPDGPVLVRAAMAHLNLVMIHPFSDGNGRMARCLQTLALARERIISPVFSSIEEYLGRNTPAYYEVLGEVGGGAWQPQRDARPWVHFCLTAHYRQARTLLRRVQEAEELWDALTALTATKRVNDRAVGPLFDAALGLRLRNPSYRDASASSTGLGISEQVASRDLKLLVDVGLLEAEGERRGRIYRATGELTAPWLAIKDRRPPREADDPFLIVATRAQGRLPL